MKESPVIQGQEVICMSSQFCERVGNNIRNNRKEANMTLKELADKVDLTEATIQKYEAGNIKKIDSELLEKIAIALSVKPEKLTGWSNKEEHDIYHKAMQGKREANYIKNYAKLNDENKKIINKITLSLLKTQ